MNEPFEAFVEKAIRQLRHDQNAFLEAYQINAYDAWYYDQPSGVFTFSKESEQRFFAFQCIGSFAPEAGTWLWSWANKFTYPEVKKDSFLLKEYGQAHQIEKLTKEHWEAEEVDGWEMLALAHWLLKPIGVYRIPTEGMFIFLIFTSELSQEEARSREEKKIELLSCDIHGLKRPTFVCQHLNKKVRKGFHEAFESWEEMELGEDDDLQAWCDEWEKVRIRHDGWNEVSEQFAKIKLVCENCYFEMKEINA